MKKTLHNFLAILEWVVFAVLLVLFAIIVSPLLPTRKYLATFAVISGSMDPTVPVGALALVREIPATQLQKGDIIAFANPDSPKATILHRITDKQQSGTIIEFKTKGDNNPVEDPWLVGAHQVKGQMFGSIPYLGQPIRFAQTPLGFAFLVGVPAGLLTILNLKAIYEGIEEEVSRRTKVAIKNKTAPAASS